jgi:hypothetical protein
MKATKLSSTKYKFFKIALLILVTANLFYANQAVAQIDYYYGRNNTGVRIGLGVGAASLNTHFNKNPYQITYIGSLDYDINPFLSFGLEGQYGTLQGIDDVHHLRYYSSTDKYFSGTANIRVAIGTFAHFETHSDLKDIIERIYLGVGVGAIKTNNKFTDHPDGTASTIYGSPVPEGNFLLIPINVGTNIDLPGVLGMDRISINPNFQLNYVNSLYLDGFQSTQTSTLKGFYNIISVKLKYKF